MESYAKTRAEQRMENYYMGLSRGKQKEDYQKWIEQNETEVSSWKPLPYQPGISVIILTHPDSDAMLRQSVESVINQSYPYWEIYMYHKQERKIGRYEKRYVSKGLIKFADEQEDTNTILKRLTGDYIVFLGEGGLLSKDALYEIAKMLNNGPELDLIYGDEDEIDNAGKRSNPYFKPDWSPDTLMSHMYIGHLAAYRKDLAIETGIRDEYKKERIYDFALRFTEKIGRIAHISKVLYHKRTESEATAAVLKKESDCAEMGHLCLEDALERRKLAARVEKLYDSSYYRCDYLCELWPCVSVVIPSKDNCEMAETCLRTFCELTDYPDYEIILVDNGSNEENKNKYMDLAKRYPVTYLYQKEDFNFSHMCNLGFQKSSGEYILLLNDDIEIISGEWLKRMVGQASLEHIGAVGAKLLYPDGKTIQHIGVINRISGPGHALSGYSDDVSYYHGINGTVHNVIAVTGACLLVKSEKYEEVKGLDETLAVSYNDVDFCFRLLEKGYYNVVRNDAVLLHHESASRGNDFEDPDKMTRLMDEQKKLYDRHPQYKGYDPFYSRNLAQVRLDYTCNIEEKMYVSEKIGQLDTWTEITGDVDICIDSWDCSNCIYISGWFFWQDSYKTNKSKLYIALRGKKNNSVLVFSANRIIREDVAEYLKNVAYNSGFECRIPYDLLEPDEEYQTGLIFNAPYRHKKAIAWLPEIGVIKM